ncbi:MAG TPA: cytochrome C oxidase subunit IV family protein [Polyangiaceae bacterium]|nr:cytochrome C oxidase subunit IV family protein [Polyangiaceae bacterium]
MSDEKPEAEKPETVEQETSGETSEKPKSEPPAAAKSEPPKAASEPPPASKKSEPAPAKKSEPPRAAADGHGHAHDDHAHGDSHDHGLAHTTPVWLLFAILGALLVLTVATVAVTSIDLGAQGNLVVAMIIATVKAALVCTFFMHLLWDKKFNLVLFLTSVLFLILFLSMATTDRGEYQHLVDEYRAQQLQTK